MSNGSFALQLQRFPKAADRVLAIGQVAALREGTKRFSVAGIATLAEGFRLPSLGNINATLGRMRDAGLVAHFTGATPWALTPLGEERVRTLIGEIPVAWIEAELVDSPGAFLGNQPHRVIPPSMAPPKWADGISRLIREYPFETNVFCMTRFPDSTGDDPIEPLLPRLREVVSGHGLTLHLASDRQLEDDLFGNVGAHMWACQYGIGILEGRAGRPLNYNVVIEIGAMIVTGRRCALLKDTTAPDLPTDFVGHIYKSVDLEDPESVAGEVGRWISDDLGL